MTTEVDEPRLVVVIDGPAGAGKSTAARRVAEALGYELLDTGAIYRCVALVAEREGIDWADEPAVARVAAALDISFALVDGVNRVYVAGEDVSDDIRTAHMSTGASKVSALPAVRAALLDLQRSMAEGGGVVAEGRDMGTVVFPHADAKFFLTANPEERARRRHAELIDAGRDAGLARTLEELQERDARDSSRAVAPLQAAPDAVVVDSSALGIDAVVTKLLEIVRARAGKRG